MIEAMNDEPRAQSVPTVPLLLVVAFTIGLLYAWGYWSSFGINILEFLSVADVVRVTAYPLAASVLMLSLGAAVGEPLQEPVKPPGRVIRFATRHHGWLLVVYVLFTIVVVGLPSAKKWYYLPILLGVPVYLFLKPRGFLTSLIPHERARAVVIFLLAVLPFASFGFGRVRAAALLNGEPVSPFMRVDVSASAVPGLQAGAKFLGLADGYAFFLTQDRQVTIVRFDGVQPLSLSEPKETKPRAPRGD